MSLPFHNGAELVQRLQRIALHGNATMLLLHPNEVTPLAMYLAELSPKQRDYLEIERSINNKEAYMFGLPLRVL